MKKFDEVMNDSVQINNLLQADHAQAKKCNVTGTPTVIINGLKLAGNRSLGNYKTRIDQILAPKDNDEAGKEEGS
jgi:protein-disulfide isomerase